MLIEKTRMPLPIGEIQFFGLSLFMIVIGTLMIFTPKIKFRSDSIE
jgi:hypothetical protein